jgi:predicted sulfurtransferase
LIPAFKETCLKTKFARDDESVGLLDIIFNNVFMDLGDMMFLDMRDAFMTEIIKNGNFASVIERKSASFQKLVDKVNESAANLD